MALIPSTRYPAQTDSASGYPQGKARNASTFQDGTGTPLEKDWVNDIWGFLQALLARAGITPTGDPDEVGASDYLDAVLDATAEASERAVLGTWTDISGSASFSQSQNNVLWAASLSLFVSVGSSGTIYTSPDAHTWTSRTADLATTLVGVAASPSLGVVAVGTSGGVTHSSDAITWDAKTSGTSEALQAVCAHDDSLFVAVGGNGAIITSPDGSTWTSRTSGTSENLLDVASNGSLIVAVGSAGVIFTSPDGTTWTSRTSGVALTLGGVVWNGSLFIVDGSSGTILTSPDGITWTSRTSGVASALNGFGVTDHYVLAVGASDVMLASRDGITWARVHHGISDVGNRAMAWNGAVAVTVGDNGGVSRSAARLPL